MGGRGSKPQWEGYEHQLMQESKPRAIPIEGTEEENATCAYRNPAAKDGFQMYMNALPPNESIVVDSGWKAFKYAAKAQPQQECFGYRVFTDAEDRTKRGDFHWDTYSEVLDRVLEIGNGMQSLGLGKEINVGIFSQNRPEWLEVHMANWSQSYRTTSLYDTLGPQAVEYIISHAEVPIIFSEKHKLAKLWEAIKSAKSKTLSDDTEDAGDDTTEEANPEPESKEEEEQKPRLKYNLKYVVQFDYQERYGNKCESVTEEDKKQAEELGLTLFGLSEIIEKGKGKKDEVCPGPESLAYIMYTSGTTGDPKGVMITHKAFSCVVGSSYRGFEPELRLTRDDIHLSYLPLAHSFEAAIIVSLLSQCARIAFFQGDVKKLSADWQAIRPTVLFGVPRVFNKTYDKIMNLVSEASGLKKKIFHKAQNKSSRQIRFGHRSKLYDKLVWKKTAAQIGWDRVRFLGSGAAPLPPHVAEFLKLVCTNAFILQGYGMTETCAVSFNQEVDDYTLGHVGIPVDNMEYRLISAPECEYYVTDKPCARGEIQMRGPCIMKGYHKNPAATKKCLSEDGWLSTGDIGRINPNGTLSIIDRRKNMFKTAMGEYVAAEKVENVYQQAPSVGQMWVYGNSYKSFIVAVIVPDAQWAVSHFKSNGKWSEDDEKIQLATPEFSKRFAEVCKANYDMLHEAITDHLRVVELSAHLERFEKIKDIVIEYELDDLLQGFNVDNNCLTPTFKLKRPQLLKRYVEKLKELYTKNGEAPKDTEGW